MRLTNGQKAKDFHLQDLKNEMISLSTYSGKIVLLSFYRYASCPLCNLRVSDLIEHIDVLNEKNIQMIAVFQSDRQSILEYVGTQSAPFPIIPDPKLELYKAYGVESSSWGLFLSLLKPSQFVKAWKRGFKPGKTDGDISRIPADFLIDSDGVILKAYYGKHIGDHMPLDMIYQLNEH